MRPVGWVFHGGDHHEQEHNLFSAIKSLDRHPLLKVLDTIHIKGQN